MRSKAVKTLVLMLLLGSVGIVLGQQQNPGGPPGNVLPTPKQKAPPAKSKLEEMLAEALKNNPDIRVAAAKLAEADAELNRTRSQVVQKVVTLYHAIETQKKVVEHAEKKQKRGVDLGLPVVSREDIEELSQTLALAKGKLEELEAQLPALLGKTPHEDYELVIQGAKLTRQEAIRSSIQTRRAMIEKEEWEWTHKPMGSSAERIRKALQTPVKVNYGSIMPFDAILDDLVKKAPGLSFHNQLNHHNQLDHAKIKKLRFEEALPVSAILQALADEIGCGFFVREYGILVIEKEKAPPGAMTVEQFLRQKPAEQPRRQTDAGKNPPPQHVEGLVKAVDKSGLMTLSIGSDAGLAKGHTMELFRISAQSKYLGTVRILEAEAKQAVAQPVGRLADTPKVGDRVASRISGK